MLKKRIIPCLDVKDGRTVKGINFVQIQDAGDAVELGKIYAEQGSDELVFLDITATIEKRKTFTQLVERVAKEIDIPFTVGGGIQSVEDVGLLLKAGADKVSVNSAAVKNPNLIQILSKEFGSQCIVLAVDTNFINDKWLVYVHGGRTPTNINTYDWIKKGESLGAGEILLTSMVHDGTKNGFAIDLYKMATEMVNIPIIASGGAGNYEDFRDLFFETNVDAALAASIFHYSEIPIPKLKKYLRNHNISIR